MNKKFSIIPKKENTEVAKGPLNEVSANQLRPAIIFDGFNVYNSEGVIKIPADVYNVFATIGSEMADIIDISSTNDTRAIDRETLNNILYTNVRMCCSNFVLAIDNIYSVYIDSINTAFRPYMEKIYKDEMSKSRTPSLVMYLNFPREMYLDDLTSVIGGNIPKMDNIQDAYNTLMFYVVSFIHRIGLKIYNDWRSEVSYNIRTVDDQTTLEMFNIMDSTFSHMMTDFVKECGSFVDVICSNPGLFHGPINARPFI